MMLKNNKENKILHNSSVGVGEDKISKLPDELIHHILSFLPIKCATSTCILSKRWNYVSNSIPILDFRKWPQGIIFSEKERRLTTRRFMNFLDTVIYLHEKPNIKKLFLSWDSLFDKTRVIKWIGTVIKRKVEELFLRSEEPFLFPLSLFTRNSLTVLDLNCLTLNVPSTVSFPRLKLLRLSTIKFGNGNLINNLLSNCPILEELKFWNCSGFESEGLCIANPALKHLRICHSYLEESTVKISAPNLKTIICKLKKPKDFLIDSFPSLVEADINILGDDRVPIKLFEKLSNVKLLKMPGDCFLRQHEVDTLLTILPAFINLIHLEVSHSGSDSCPFVRRFFSLIQLLPNLETIVFSRRICIPDKGDDGCWSLDPKCSPPHLKSIKFMYFDGEPEELNAVKIFLKYARFLETVTIVASPKLSRDQKEQLNVAKVLLKFPKPANCVVDLRNPLVSVYKYC
ncbi:hypothetical protein MKW92_033835 [Papaver armeniacum]|nr:hypothetical protein MKW92_033835 [Papaver armeniacum]